MKRSRGSPLAALLVTAVAVTAALGWFGWKLFDQQRKIEDEGLRQRVENGADALALDIRRALADVGDQLSAWLSNPESPLPEVHGAVVFALARGSIRVSPPGSLPFVPRDLPLPRMEARFRAAETLEFQSQDLSAAAAVYRAFTANADQTVRAVALFRLGTVLRRSHDVTASLDAHRKLEAFGDVDVEGYPAELAALDGQRLTLIESGQRDQAQRIGNRIVNGIDQGRWPISRATAETFRESLTTLPRPESWKLAGALEDLWREWDGRPPQPGMKVDVGDDRRVLLLSRAGAGDVVALAAFVDQFLPRPSVDGIGYEITDADDARIAGNAPPPASSVTRVAGDWTVRVWDDGTQRIDAPLISARGQALAVATTVALFLWSTVYFTARAMRREARVARLQSDFVSAVSHEFRSPLTTIRQLAELLEMGEVPSEARRQTYYEVLARESRRLQRLVETLLNFGRMEADAERYRLEPVSIPDLVRQVAREVEAQHSHAGLRVEVGGLEEGVSVRGDADALALAIRNLLDNAVKYSPGADSVRVEWAVDGHRVSIRVADDGLGIEPSEKDAIFGKFVRGKAAAAANVKGTGVGLAMVRHVLTAHGGQISVESEVGRGSTFTVLLPAAH